MRYLYFILIFLIAAFLFLVLNFYNNDWQLVQPFLIALLLIYFNSEKKYFHYMFAFLGGFFVDSFTGVFGLHASIFVIIIFLVENLHLTILSSKNILAIMLLTLFSFLMFWLLFFISDLMFNWNLYVFDSSLIKSILKITFIDIFLVIFLHLIYYNFWLKGHGQKQSF